MGWLYYDQNIRPKIATLGHLSEPNRVILTDKVTASASPVQKTFYQDGKWRFDGPSGTRTIHRDGEVYVLDVRGFVTIEQEEGLQPDFTLEDALRDAARQGERTREEETTFKGKRVIRVVAQDPASPESRNVQLFDPESHWVIVDYMETRTSAGWQTSREIDSDYTSPVPASTFAIRFPDEEPLVRTYLSVQAAMRGTMAKFLVDGRVVVLRRADVNADGEVFLLYTDGMGLGGALETTKPNAVYRFFAFSYKPRFQLADSNGARYVEVKAVPCFSIQGNDLNLVATAGQTLHGIWFKPDNLKKWSPRTLRITVQGAAGPDFVLPLQHPSAKGTPWWMGQIGVKP